MHRSKAGHAATDSPETPAAVTPPALTPERLMAQIALVAFADVRRLFNPDGTLKPICELDDDTAAALSVEVEDGSAKRTAKLKIDRVAALTLLGKYLLDDRAAAEDGSGLAEAIAAARMRAP